MTAKNPRPWGRSDARGAGWAYVDVASERVTLPDDVSPDREALGRIVREARFAHIPAGVPDGWEALDAETREAWCRAAEAVAATVLAPVAYHDVGECYRDDDAPTLDTLPLATVALQAACRKVRS